MFKKKFKKFWWFWLWATGAIALSLGAVISLICLLATKEKSAFLSYEQIMTISEEGDFIYGVN